MAIDESIIDFLRLFGFERAEWDGNELTCYLPDNDEPFGIREFKHPSLIRFAWQGIEDFLARNLGNNPSLWNL